MIVTVGLGAMVTVEVTGTKVLVTVTGGEGGAGGNTEGGGPGGLLWSSGSEFL